MWQKDLFLGEFLKNALVFLAGVFGYQVDQSVEYAPPGFVLTLSVRDAGDWVAVLVCEGDLSNEFSVWAIERFVV